MAHPSFPSLRRTLALHWAQLKEPFFSHALYLCQDSNTDVLATGFINKICELLRWQRAVRGQTTVSSKSSTCCQPLERALEPRHPETSLHRRLFCLGGCNSFWSWKIKGESSRTAPAGSWKAVCFYNWNEAPTYVVMIFSRGSGGSPTVSCLWCDRRSVHAYCNTTESKRSFSETCTSHTAFNSRKWSNLFINF